MLTGPALGAAIAIILAIWGGAGLGHGVKAGWHKLHHPHAKQVSTVKK